MSTEVHSPDMPSPTKTAANATLTTIGRAVQAADRGASTTLKASTRMTIETALAFALELVDEDACGGRATAYVTDGVLYVGPRKRLPDSTA